MITNAQLKDAATQIISILKTNNKPFASYALSYLRLIDNQWEMQQHATHYGETLESALKTQCLYALNNLSSWRHERAKELRQVLKDYAKQN